MPELASRNRTVKCTLEEIAEFSESILEISKPVKWEDISCQLIQGDFTEIARFFPKKFIDLLILDPPYNLTKNYNGHHFKKQDSQRYISWFAHAVDLLKPMMKLNATVYVCSDWQTSTLILPVLKEKLIVQNRITWEREKGRGAKRNWKNNTEDI